MAMYAKVRRMRLRDGLSISEIARRTSLSRNTIKTWLRTPVRSEMKYQRLAGPKKIGPYEAGLREALAADARRPRRERRTAQKLYTQLQQQGFPGSYARVTEFMRAWYAEQGAVAARAAYVPLSFRVGRSVQFDWSEEGLVIGGVWRKVQLAHMKLCASLAFWLGRSLGASAHAPRPRDPRRTALSALLAVRWHATLSPALEAIRAHQRDRRHKPGLRRWDCSTTARGGGVCAAPGATDVRGKRETETDQLRNIDIGRESGSHNRPQERTTLYPMDDSTSPRHQRGNNRSSSTL